MLISHKVHSIKCSLFNKCSFQNAELHTSGSEHHKSGSEHHACRNSTTQHIRELNTWVVDRICHHYAEIQWNQFVGM